MSQNRKKFTLSAVFSLFLALIFALAPTAYIDAAGVSVSIQSLYPSTTVSVGTNTSFSITTSGFTNPTYSLTDSFSGGTVSSSNIGSSGNFGWTPGAQDVGTHNLTITVSDSSGDTATTTEQLTVTAAPTVSIQSLSPSSSISNGTTLSFTAVTTGFTNPFFTASDSFSGGSFSPSDINSSGYFSWTPTTSDNGTHVITINVTDSLGHAASANETITVNSAGSVSIQSVSPSTSINVSQNVTFYVSTSNFVNPSFSLSDSFSGGTISNANINSSGNFSWTPSSNDAGSHNITVNVSDASGHSGSASVTLTVQGIGVSIQSVNPSTNVMFGTPLSFTASASGFTNPVYTLSDSFGGSTISNADINSSGYFSWTPTVSDAGTHNIVIYATDSYGHSSNTTEQITVQGPSVSISSISPSTDIQPGTTLTFSANTTGFSSPLYSVSDSFGSASTLSSSDINSSGNFSWTPTSADDGTHSVVVTASDGAGHTAQAEVTISVGVSSTSGSVSTSAAYTFSQYLSPGSTGDDVTALQTLLTKLGFFSGPITGYYGTLTETAVENFQTAHGIDSLGVVGPATRAELNQLETSAVSTATSTSSSSSEVCTGGALFNILTGAKCSQTIETTTSSSTTTIAPGDGYKFENPLDVGSSGTDVTELQQRLTTDGYYSGPITGYYGSLTQAAVEALQTKNGLDPLGNVGPNTRALLNGN